MLKQAFAENANSPALYNSLGMTDFERQDYDAAVSSFDKAIDLSRDFNKIQNKLDQPHPMYLNNRGLANHFLKHFDAAIADFNEAIRLEDGDPIIYFNRGNAYLNMGTEESIELAYKDFETASTINPYTPKFWHAKGLAKQS